MDNATSPWIPIFAAIVSAGAVLIGTWLANRQAIKLKKIETEKLRAERRADEMASAGEEIYLALQKIAKSTGRAADISIEILDGKIESKRGIEKMKQSLTDVDSLRLRFQLERFFPEVHSEWVKFERHLQKQIELGEILKKNLPKISARVEGKRVRIPNVDEYRNLNDECRREMHDICSKIIAKLQNY